MYKIAQITGKEISEGVSRELYPLDPTAFSLGSLGMSAFETLLMVAGVIAVGAFVAAGIFYLTSFGDEAKAEKAKKFIFGTIIGILLIAFSYGLAVLIRARI